MAKRSFANHRELRRNPTESRSTKRKRHKRESGTEPANIYRLALFSEAQPQLAPIPPRRGCGYPLRARTPAQAQYISAIRKHCLTFGIGPAGTGKSYCAAALAVEELQSGRTDRLILTRPAVTAGESFGFLPGEIDEKFAVYVQPVRDVLEERIGSGAVEYYMKHGRIHVEPLAFMRGTTFGEGTFVILDEAQNTTVTQMKMFLSRIGEGCKVVVNGDIDQSDIRGLNGLADAVTRLEGLANVYLHRFDRDDIVRSGLVRELMDRYET